MGLTPYLYPEKSSDDLDLKDKENIPKNYIEIWLWERSYYTIFRGFCLKE
jgi:hypothetical protein